MKRRKGGERMENSKCPQRKYNVGVCVCVCVKAQKVDSRWIRRRGLQGSPQRQRKAGLIDRSASGRL